jgi:aminoglycoside 2'-N-acetyltransferase I
VIDVRIAHTARLGESTRRAARTLDAAFGGFPDTDWEHALGGLHALVRDGDDLVAHGSVVNAGWCTAGGRCAPGTSRPSACTRTGGARGTRAA